MTVDYRSLLVRVHRGVPNHLTPTHTLGLARIASTGSYDTCIVISGYQAAVKPPQHIAHETKMLARRPSVCDSGYAPPFPETNPTFQRTVPMYTRTILKRPFPSMLQAFVSTSPGWATLIF